MAEPERDASWAGPPRGAVPADPWEFPLDPLLCPYCAALTWEADRRCLICNGELWVSVRRREQHSFLLWLVMMVQVWSLIGYVIVPFLVLTALAFLIIGRFDAFALLPVYLGLPGDLSPEVGQAARELLSPWLLLPFVALSLYSLGMLIGSYLRWKPVFYLLLVGAGVRLALAAAALAAGGLTGLRFAGLVGGGLSILAALITFLIILRLEDDFFCDEHRIYFAMDPRVKSGVGLITRGREYARQKMWALAVLYFRAGVARAPDQVAGHTGLISAYLHLNRRELAEVAGREAQRRFPDHPTVIELVNLIDHR